MPSGQERLQAWRVRGAFVIPGWLSPPERRDLGEACDHALACARAESRVAGHVSTHIPSVLTPDYYRDRPELLERLIRFIHSPPVLSIVGEVGRPLEGELELRAVHYFHEPSARDYDGPWHRDGDEATPIHANARVERQTHVRFRVAFAPDDHLEYVPGSHIRPDTEAELQMRRGAVRNGPLPGAVERIELDAGDLCVFDTWGIHRGRYRHGRVRRTLDLVFGFGARRYDYGQWLELRKFILTK